MSGIEDSWILTPVSVSNLLQNYVLVENMEKMQTQRDMELKKGGVFNSLLEYTSLILH